MTYHQITSGERYMISALRKQGCSVGEVARQLQRHRSSIGRELRRNACRHGWYRPSVAIERTNGRRSRSRRNRRFSLADLTRVEALLAEKWSPEQIAGYLRRTRELPHQHETILPAYLARPSPRGHALRHLRGTQAPTETVRSVRQPRPPGRKRHISERPLACDHRARIGHWEIDTVLGTGSQHCVLSVVERKSGYLLLGKLRARTTDATTPRTVDLVQRHARRFRTITADNGTEFHDYRTIGAHDRCAVLLRHPTSCLGARHEREHQRAPPSVPPKGRNLARLTQADCEQIARHLNRRPRKRLHFPDPRRNASMVDSQCLRFKVDVTRRASPDRSRKVAFHRHNVSRPRLPRFHRIRGRALRPTHCILAFATRKMDWVERKRIKDPASITMVAAYATSAVASSTLFCHNTLFPASPTSTWRRWLPLDGVSLGRKRAHLIATPANQPATQTGKSFEFKRSTRNVRTE